MNNYIAYIKINSPIGVIYNSLSASYDFGNSIFYKFTLLNKSIYLKSARSAHERYKISFFDDDGKQVDVIGFSNIVTNRNLLTKKYSVSLANLPNNLQPQDSDGIFNCDSGCNTELNNLQLLKIDFGNNQPTRMKIEVNISTSAVPNWKELDSSQSVEDNVKTLYKLHFIKNTSSNSIAINHLTLRIYNQYSPLSILEPGVVSFNAIPDTNIVKVHIVTNKIPTSIDSALANARKYLKLSNNFIFGARNGNGKHTGYYLFKTDASLEDFQKLTKDANTLQDMQNNLTINHVFIVGENEIDPNYVFDLALQTLSFNSGNKGGQGVYFENGQQKKINQNNQFIFKETDDSDSSNNKYFLIKTGIDMNNFLNEVQCATNFTIIDSRLKTSGYSRAVTPIQAIDVLNNTQTSDNGAGGYYDASGKKTLKLDKFFIFQDSGTLKKFWKVSVDNNATAAIITAIFSASNTKPSSFDNVKSILNVYNFAYEDNTTEMTTNEVLAFNTGINNPGQYYDANGALKTIGTIQTKFIAILDQSVKNNGTNPNGLYFALYTNADLAGFKVAVGTSFTDIASVTKKLNDANIAYNPNIEAIPANEVLTSINNLAGARKFFEKNNTEKTINASNNFVFRVTDGSTADLHTYHQFFTNATQEQFASLTTNKTILADVQINLDNANFTSNNTKI